MKILKKGAFKVLALLLLISTPYACDNEDDLNIIAGLDFTIATLNTEGNQTGVVATTIPPDGRILFTVDFGNPNDDEDVFETNGPMVMYNYPLETATYTITVTASLPGREDVTITKDHTVIYVTEPDPTPNSPIAGTWKLAPIAGAFGVGPGFNDTSWFSSSADDVTTRDCLFDDEYVFGTDGSFMNVLGDQTWLEAWQGQDPEACGTPVAPHDGSGAATYTFNAAMGTLTLNGTGAFMGLAKVVNGAELAAPGDAPDSITYVAELSADGTMLELDIQVAGDGWWSFTFQKDGETPPPAPSALEGVWKMAPEAGAFFVGPGFNSSEWFSSSADDVTTRACFFDDEYVFGADGSFMNVLGADTWLETWQGAATEGCGAPVAPHDGSNAATYTYDENAGTITLNGQGAYLGLSKVVNGAELTAPGEAPNSVTYQAELTDDGTRLEVDIQIAGDGWWSFTLVKDDTTAPASPIVGSWALAPEAGAFFVGPGFNSSEWFSSSADDVTTRACLFDDEYVFGADGSFTNVLGADTWLETWQGAATEGCGTPVAPHDGSGSATYTYDEGAGTVTLDGTGAFLGLAKVVNGSELTAPGDAPSSITYQIEITDDGNRMEIDIQIAGDGWWSFSFVKQ